MTGAPHLVPIGPADRDQVRRWLSMPEVQAFWGSAAAAEAEVSLALAGPGTICRMIEIDGATVGYAHALDCVLLGGDHAAALPPATWDCAVFIASAGHRGRGLGGRALALLVAEVFSTTLALACVIRVPVRSEAAARAVEGVGFRWERIAGDAALGPVWVMRIERPRR
ncbi:MAG: GNAT family N-acetyltransferase [Hyphomicrobiaceae bacterium]|nr:GNAT family N-acetyltransferase [Hyphomicrobiaceae bacterium]